MPYPSYHTVPQCGARRLSVRRVSLVWQGKHAVSEMTKTLTQSRFSRPNITRQRRATESRRYGRQSRADRSEKTIPIGLVEAWFRTNAMSAMLRLGLELQIWRDDVYTMRTWHACNHRCGDRLRCTVYKPFTIRSAVTLYSAMLTFFWLDMSAEILLIYLPTYSN